MIGARGSLTNVTFRLDEVTAATAVVEEAGEDEGAGWTGDLSEGLGEVCGAGGGPPIKSLTSLLTSSLSLDNGSGDFVRLGTAP